MIVHLLYGWYFYIKKIIENQYKKIISSFPHLQSLIKSRPIRLQRDFRSIYIDGQKMVWLILDPETLYRRSDVRWNIYDRMLF